MTGRKRRTRGLRRVVVLAAVVLGGLAIYAHYPGGNDFTISPETTYLTGPVHSDGTINYVQAIIDRCDLNIPQEDNAAVAYLRVSGPPGVLDAVWDAAFGMPGVSDMMWDETITELGLPKDQSFWQGPYMVGFVAYYKKAHGDEGDTDPRELIADIYSAPWAADEHPTAAQWLEAIAEPLDLVVQGTRRRRLAVPIISAGDRPRVALILNRVDLGMLRKSARALGARAMLRLRRGENALAMADLKAIHRMAAQLMDQPQLLTVLDGMGIENIALRGDRALLAAVGYATEAEWLLGEFQSLPAVGNFESAMLTERLVPLDFVAIIYRDGLTEFAGGEYSSKIRPVDRRPNVDWNELMRTINNYWDRQAEALGQPTFPQAQRLFEGIDRTFAHTFPGDSWTDQLSPRRLLAYDSGGRLTRKQCTRYILREALGGPGFSMEAMCRGRHCIIAQRRLNKLAAATLVFRAATGQYPEDLPALVPSYIKALPTDPFAASPFAYERTETGCKMYSVGENLTDDGGSNTWDDKDADIPKGADDLVVELMK